MYIIRFLFLLLWVGFAHAQISDKTLDNGLRVVIKEDHRAPVATYQLWYKVGSIDEKVGKTGLSHALEHMMFKGTDKIPAGEYSRRVSALGGHDNAYTSRDETVYHATLAAKNLAEILTLEADRMSNLNFSDEDFYNEMKVIKEERRMRTDDSPQGKLIEGIYKNAFKLPFNQAPVIGWMADLDDLTATDLRAWYQQWYAPNNATLIIVGDVVAEDLLKQIEKDFGSLQSKPLPARNQGQENFLMGFKRTEVSAPSELPIISLNWRVAKLQKSDDKTPYALTVLAEILSGHSASRLSKSLVREKQLAVSAYADYSALSRGETLFTLLASPSEGVDNSTLIAALKNEIKQIATNGVSPKELDRIHYLMDAEQIFEQDSIQAQVTNLAIMEFMGLGYQFENQFRQNIKAVTASEIKQAAQLLVDEALTEVTLKPLPLAETSGENK